MGLAGGVVDHPQWAGSVRQHLDEARHHLGRIAAEDPALCRSIDEQQVDQAPPREAGDVVEHDGLAGLCSERAHLVESDLLLHVDVVVPVLGEEGSEIVHRMAGRSSVITGPPLASNSFVSTLHHSLHVTC